MLSPRNLFLELLGDQLAVEIDICPKMDEQWHHFDPKVLSDLGQKVAGTVGHDAHGLYHVYGFSSPAASVRCTSAHCRIAGPNPPPDRFSGNASKRDHCIAATSSRWACNTSPMAIAR